MGKFIFNENVIDNVTEQLNDFGNYLNEKIEPIKSVLFDLYSEDGFNISYVIDELNKEIEKFKHCFQNVEMTKNTLKSISKTVHEYSANAILVEKVYNVGTDAINSVIKNQNIGSDVAPPEDYIHDDRAPVEDGNDVAPDKDYVHDDRAPAPTLEDIAPKGTILNERSYEKNGYFYTPVTYNGKDILLRTDSAGGIGLFQMDESLFPTYNQHYQHFTHGEYPGVECTSTALAQSSTINGIYKTANDYNDGAGITQIGGYQCSSYDITRFCVDRLKMGQSTVIYYNYAGSEYSGINNGHAVVVVGANANPTSVYDLHVIDPATGAYVNFGAACGQKSNSMYICYESNPWAFGGEATKPWDIESYFGVHLY